MRYLVFGDVHANLAALDAVLAAAKRRGVEACLFVGDLIGYGPDPLECIRRLAEIQSRQQLGWVAGNHELVVRGDIESAGYSAEATETLEWTRELVEKTDWARKFLASGELTLEVNEKIFLTHDSLAEPTSGTYHRWPRNARSELACLRWKGGRICFYGHTHMMRGETVSQDKGIVLVPMTQHERDDSDPHPLRLGEDELAWVGTGSVGLPTTAERKAEYLILDDRDPASWIVEKYVVAYPREQTRARVREVLGGVCSGSVVERLVKWF